MNDDISALLLRNLHEVFEENDPLRRRAAIDQIFHEDAVFHEPKGSFRGRDEIDRIAGLIKSSHPDYRYQIIGSPAVTGDAGRLSWVSAAPGEPPAYAGTDFVLVREGKIAALSLFFDKLESE